MPIFFIFIQFWLYFGQKKAKKCQNKKSGSVMNFHLLWSNYIPNFRKFHQTVWILPIFFIFSQFWLFFGQKRQQKKCQKSKNSFFVAFYFVGKHLHTKLQIFSSNSLDFANFLDFGQFWQFFGQKRLKSKNSFFVAFYLLGSIYIPNFKKNYQTV